MLRDLADVRRKIVATSRWWSLAAAEALASRQIPLKLNEAATAEPSCPTAAAV